jgi:hypothetical protein|tara:strand:- start:2514 stop:2867 length:354 start_codon:yes stop_codon:yes gene_type:complete
MTEEANEMWTIEELVQMTEKVQSTNLDWQGKKLHIQWCELVEAEEPKMAIPTDDMPEEEQTEYFKKMASERVLAMIKKANDKNPEGTSLTEENWGSLPTTLRWSISSTILGTQAENL